MAAFLPNLKKPPGLSEFMGEEKNKVNGIDQDAILARMKKYNSLLEEK